MDYYEYLSRGCRAKQISNNCNAKLIIQENLSPHTLQNVVHGAIYSSHPSFNNGGIRVSQLKPFPCKSREREKVKFNACLRLHATEKTENSLKTEKSRPQKHNAHENVNHKETDESLKSEEYAFV